MQLQRKQMELEVEASRLEVEIGRREAGLPQRKVLSPAIRLSLKRAPGEKRTGLSNFIQIDPNSDETIQQQLKAGLARCANRVIDLFREWDVNGDGEVSKKEFRMAMKVLGLDVPKAELNTLFDSFDADGSGTIDYLELRKALHGMPTRTVVR